MPRKRKSPAPDGRANNGGVRVGTPGTRYPNRQDLTQPPSAARNQPYGQAGQQITAQRAVPLPQAPPPATAQPGRPATPFATPNDTPTLTAPTQRPNEPLEAGLPFGPGPGPEAMGPPPMSDTEARLRALYSVSPNPQLRELIAQLEQGG